MYFNVPVQGADPRTMTDLSCQHRLKEEKWNNL